MTLQPPARFLAGPQSSGGGSSARARRPSDRRATRRIALTSAARNIRLRVARVRRGGELDPDEHQAVTELIATLERLLEEPPRD